MNTVTMKQGFNGLEGEAAIREAQATLPAALDEVLAAASGLHPLVVADIVTQTMRDYKQQTMPTWPPVFLPDVTGNLGEAATLLEGNPRAARVFVDMCNRDLQAGRVLTLERRKDLAGRALEQEAELAAATSASVGNTETIDDPAHVRIIRLEGVEHVAIEPRGVDVTPAQARALAALLSQAADKIDKGTDK